MKKEKIFEFEIDKPLNPARRRALEQNIAKNAALSPKAFKFGWDKNTADLLHIVADPVKIEIAFQPEKVELFASAPVWAKVGFTEKKKAEIRRLIQSVLEDSKLISAST